MLEKLTETICHSSEGLSEQILAGGRLQALQLRRSARLPIAASLWRCSGKPLLLLTDRLDRALTYMDEIGLWAPSARRFLFSEPTPLFYENASWGDATRRDRLTALTALALYHIPGASIPPSPPIIIAPARALMTRTLPRRDFLKASRLLKRGQRVLMDDLIRQWISLGYESTTIVIGPGQFARRGGLLDVWPPAETQPARFEFFGDDLESIRRFDPATQRTIRPTASSTPEDRILITPAREYLLPSGERALEPGEISEFHIPLLHPSVASLMDYLPGGSLILLDDWEAVSDSISEVESQSISLRQDFVKDGTLAQDFPLPYLTLTELNETLAYHTNRPSAGPNTKIVVVELAHSLQAPPSESGPSLPADWFAPGPRFAGRLKPFMDYLLECKSQAAAVVVVSRQQARLAELWAEAERDAHSAAESAAAADGQASPPPTAFSLSFLDGSLGEGWIFTPPGQPALHLITDGEIFGWKRPEPRQRHRPAAEAPEALYSDLSPGDWVVHVDHGIGQFQGLVRRTVDDSEREYLCVEYAEGAQLYVPVHQVDRLTRYVGPEGHEPVASRLGSQEWKSVKAHVKEAVLEVAEDLLELYARRSVVKGYAFGPDSTWQEELEASFPYIETDDQVRVIAEVKRDMENVMPMDRLICGDVGYGKTEVALRAAFKAVNDGKQVAILVPTTVLAQQHFNTFTQRLAAFPISLEMLSRFRNAQQQKDIIERLNEGGIDIIIGTHRLLSHDVQFKNLGLLIIDEEQRFGVTHKEALKKMRTEVDVLTLTATPIPRTLYMALSGVRDISTINTPPEERLPIVTHVGPYAPKLVRQAVLRELERGGQVFFVHNRVQTIGAMRSHLEKLLPEARITVAHGQMLENDLSVRMEMFSKGEVDILLSTSIIESGLDIPNANTLIVDRADTFGLAQLYQLRGRVGRGAQRAYAYFFRHNKKAPTEEGRQRLETIAENTQLGAGFSIAMRDLEIRGTGDILGVRQSGHIAAVGFHLYTRLLADAVRRLRSDGNLPAAAINIPAFTALNAQLPATTVELPLSVSIPADYVPDRHVRLGLYRRMANLHSLRELDALADEYKDRFGEPPAPVLNLLFQFKIKLLAENAGIATVGFESGQITLKFAEGEIPPGSPGPLIPKDLPALGPEVRLGRMAIWLPYSVEGVADKTAAAGTSPDAEGAEKRSWRTILVETLETLARRFAAPAPAGQPGKPPAESIRQEVRDQ